MLTCLVSLAMSQSDLKPKLEFSDLRKLSYVFSPQISPDGSQVAYVQGRQNFQTDRPQAELQLYDVKTSTTRPITHGLIAATTPHWSPDGQRLAVTAFDRTFTLQIFLLPLGAGDPIQITHSPTSVGSFSWSPDGKWMAFTADESDSKPTDGSDRFNHSFEVGNDPIQVNSPPKPVRLFVVPSTGGDAKSLAAEGRPLQNAVPPATSTPDPAWSRDGRFLYVVSQKSASYGDAWWSNRIERVTVADGKMEPITGAPGFELSVAASPTSDQIAYWAQMNPKSQLCRIFVSSELGKPGHVLSPGLQVDQFLALWSADGRSILTGGNTSDTAGLWKVSLDGTTHRITLNDVRPDNSFGLDASMSRDGAIVFRGVSSTSPWEIYYLSGSDAQPVNISHANDFLRDRAVAETRTLTWKCDGFSEEGIVTTPPNYDRTHRYPVVVIPHGGPQDSSKLGFQVQSQYLANLGFVIFEPNYRGSDNGGERYMQAIWNDAGAGPARDVFAGIRELEKQPSIDSSRESVCGWSYGGFMSAWLIGHDHRWKCAVCGAAILDWTAMRTLSDFGPMVDLGFRGKLWKDGLSKEYAEQSPITYAGKITTPTLILADSGDQRVPATQSYGLFNALRERNIPTQFVLYPVQSHSPNDPVQREDVLRRIANWLVTWTKGAPSAHR